MSFSAMSGLSSGISPTALATEPESVRRGGQAAQQAYETGLGFESMLVNELAQQMTSTISGDGSSDGLGGSSDSGSAGDGGSTDPAAGAYSSLLPTALTEGVMSGQDNGLAMQIAQGIDPKLAWSSR